MKLTQPRSRRSSSNEFRGVVASISASVLFGVMFFLPPHLLPLDGFGIYAWRIVLTLPLVLALFAFTGRFRSVVAIVRRLRKTPKLVFVMGLNGLLMGTQLWLFGWSPQTGNGLAAALGYLLLPLVMVVVGRFVYREVLSGLRFAAVGFAAAGVTVAIFLGGGISWVTLLAALGYPLYFYLRRRYQLESAGVFAAELAVQLPIALFLLSFGGGLGTVIAHPNLVPIVLLIGGISAVSLALYLGASSWLSFGLFGLLTYLEPVLLVVVSVLLLGEEFRTTDIYVYGPILIALTLLAVESLRRGRH